MQLGYDEEIGPMHGMYGTWDAELDVQRTVKRAELTAFFLSLFGKAFGPTMVHVKGLLTGCGEEERGASAQERRTRTCGF